MNEQKITKDFPKKQGGILDSSHQSWAGKNRWVIAFGSNVFLCKRRIFQSGFTYVYNLNPRIDNPLKRAGEEIASCVLVQSLFALSHYHSRSCLDLHKRKGHPNNLTLLLRCLAWRAAILHPHPLQPRGMQLHPRGEVLVILSSPRRPSHFRKREETWEERAVNLFLRHLLRP
jgi:hypothetical protein